MVGLPQTGPKLSRHDPSACIPRECPHPCSPSPCSDSETWLWLQVTYYAYATLLGSLLAYTVRHASDLAAATAALARNSSALAQSVAILASLLAMVWGFHERLVFFLICAALGALTPLAVPAQFRLRSLSCSALLTTTGMFTMLPIHKQPSLVLILAPCAALIVALVGLALWSQRCPAATPCPGAEPAGLLVKLLAAYQACPRLLWLQGALIAAAAIAVTASQPPPPPTDAGARAAHSTVRLWLDMVASLDTSISNALAPLRAAVTAPLRLPGPLDQSSATQLSLQALAAVAPALPLASPLATFPRLASTLLGLFVPFVAMTISWEAAYLATLSTAALAYCSLAVDISDASSCPARSGPALVFAAAHSAPARARQAPSSVISRNGAAIKSHALDVLDEGTAAVAAVLGRRSRQAVPPSATDGTAPAINGAAVATGEVGMSNVGAMAAVTAGTRGAGLLGEAWEAVALILGINLAFFGTGNMASVASFEPASVLRLITCGSPPPTCLW
jgi:Phosphatidylinositolglycan class N (PIG-N)